MDPSSQLLIRKIDSLQEKICTDCFQQMYRRHAYPRLRCCCLPATVDWGPSVPSTLPNTPPIAPRRSAATGLRAGRRKRGNPRHRCQPPACVGARAIARAPADPAVAAGAGGRSLGRPPSRLPNRRRAPGRPACGGPGGPIASTASAAPAGRRRGPSRAGAAAVAGIRVGGGGAGGGAVRSGRGLGRRGSPDGRLGHVPVLSGAPGQARPAEAAAARADEAGQCLPWRV